jgi:DNA-directed RNA polymerase beta subunit
MFNVDNLLKISRLYYNTYNSASMNIESFKQAEENIFNIIEKQFRKEISINKYLFVITFENVKLYGPDKTLNGDNEIIDSNVKNFPSFCKKEKLTYSMTLIADLVIEYTEINKNDRQKLTSYLTDISVIKDYNEKQPQRVVFSKWLITSIPLMIKSDKCLLKNITDPYVLLQLCEDPSDIGGYFVIDGLSRMVMSIDTSAHNIPRISINDHNDQHVRLDIINKKGVMFENSTDLAIVITINNIGHFTTVNAKQKLIKYDIGLIFGSSTKKKRSHEKETNIIPFKLMFNALGINTDKEIFKYILSIDIEKEYLIENNKIKMNSDIYQIYTFLSNVMIESKITRSNEKLSKLEKEEVGYIKNLSKEDALFELNKYNYERGYVENLLDIVKQEDRSALIARSKKFINDKFLSQCETDTDKVIELGKYIKQLISVHLKIEPETNRDSLEVKRIKGVGDNYAQEIKKALNKNVMSKIGFVLNNLNNVPESSLLSTLNLKITQLSKSLSDEFSKAMLSAFKQPKKGFGDNVSISKIQSEGYDPKSTYFIMNKLKEVGTALSAGDGQEIRIYERRKLQNSHMYFFDPVHTPEAGAEIGKPRQMTCYANISNGTDPQPIKDFIDQYILKNKMQFLDYTININGIIIGYISRDMSYYLYQEFLRKRRIGEFHPTVSISYDVFSRNINIFTDRGRPYVPFLILDENGNPDKLFEYLDKLDIEKTTWNELMKSGFIEYVDPIYINNCLIAENINAITKVNIDINKGNFIHPPFTHLALTSSLLSLMMSCDPFLTTNKAMRGTMISNHIKSNIGIPLMTPQFQYLNELNLMNYTNQQLTGTKTYTLSNMSKQPNGQILWIAFMSMGENQADATLINEDLIRRHIMDINHFQVMEDEFKTGEQAGYNPKTAPKEYSHIDSNTGFPKKIGQLINTGDILLVRQRIMKDKSEPIPIRFTDYVEHEKNYKPTIRYLGYHKNNNNKFQIILSSNRIIGISDKMTTQNGQKGTVGAIYKTSQMPYIENGTRPDIVMNIQSLTKRETYGELITGISNLISMITCSRYDGTCNYYNRSFEEMLELVKTYGGDSYLKQKVYSGISGEELKEGILMLPIYYGRSKHMIEDKFSVRFNGPMDPLTKQPKTGRSKKGGYQIDHMSRHCLMASGASRVIQEITSIQSDGTVLPLCPNCFQFGHYKNDLSNPYCPICKQNAVNVYCSYGAQFLQDIYNICGFALRIIPTINKTITYM